ncbi:YihY/virulence factor BrkB family protein [Falsarthrobacter nasiphocae]|uniref:Membrane protein n=1 Tax=Falsarthrobacter nasiphocae TaxID=189863 RepID=A0AAE3YEE2_9MICC|nr:YihY/virulence factor BrkB family protein [Falsarthrobacter nasiphocae]MDR6891675.1 membrane protein [Falsarthrobacter nasiphocae]
MPRTRRLRSDRKTYPVQEKAEQTSPTPLDPAQLNVEVLERKAELSKAKRDGTSTLGPTLKLFLARLNQSKPMRSWTLYSQRHGPLMAAGSAYNMFFSVAALLVAGFSILGLLAAGNTALQDLVVESVSKTVPNLIDTGNGGLATKEDLFDNAKGGYSLALAISIATTLVTALGWINGLREGMRGVFGLPPIKLSFPVLKARDLGTLLLLGVALILTTAVGSIFTGLTQMIMDWLRLDSGFARLVIQVAGFVVMLALDAVVAYILFRVASGIKMSRKAVVVSALIAGLGSTLLRLFSAQILSGATKNPLLAPFAVILGLFIWFYFLSQVYLLSTAVGRVLHSDEELRRESHLDPHKPSLLRRAKTGKRDLQAS